MLECGDASSQQPASFRDLRAVQACSSPRDRALALVPFYADARIAETVALDLDDVQLSARKGVLRIYGKGQRVREIPIHPELRKVLAGWLDERPDWPAANTGPALFLNQRSQRLSARGAHDVITGIAAPAGLEDNVTVHVLRHSFATTLVRGGTDLVIAAELLGHARLETTRAYTRPSAEDRSKAVDLLPVDESPRPLCGFQALQQGAIAGFGRILGVPYKLETARLQERAPLDLGALLICAGTTRQARDPG